MRLFLDTEWAVQPDLVVELAGWGIVSEDEQSVFYAECDRLPEEVHHFVHQAGYPLLERGAFAKRPSVIAQEICAWIGKVRAVDGTPPVFCYSFQMDAQLIRPS